jgi:hypothetical protein
MTDFEEKRKMALQINPGIGVPTGAQEGGAQKATAPNGVPNQDAANQFADLLKQPAEQEPKKGSSMPPFGSPFQSSSRTEQAPGATAQTVLGGALLQPLRLRVRQRTRRWATFQLARRIKLPRISSLIC